MSASTSAASTRRPFSAPILVVAGIVLAVLAWSLPVNLKSVSPGLLREAGAGTPSLATFGRQLVDSEKIGSAAQVLAAAKGIGDPGAAALETSLQQLVARQPAMVAWGGWDPFLDPIFKLRSTDTGHRKSTPVLELFITAKARTALSDYLAQTGSLGVQSVLKTRDLTLTGRFVPAGRPGGQPLDAVILLTAMLYQGEHMSPALQREVRALAETALAKKELGNLEPFYADILSLGKRLDWVQLGELLRRTEDTKTVGEYAQLARVAPDQLPVIYTAALFSDSADQVATYLLRYGKAGLEDLRLALASGQGAARQLLLWQVPVNRAGGKGFVVAAALVLQHPVTMLVVKYLGYVLAAFMLLLGLDRWIVAPATENGQRLPRMKSGALAVLFSALLIVATEPFLLKAAPPSEYTARLVLPVLVTHPELPATETVKNTTHMDTSTLISIGFFAALQVTMYFICLLKIREIARSSHPPLVKLKLMENEENLFDGGLYVGIAGTATALVLQVLGVIEPNLLAAYSSNLFGIICVAMVKIRHVRPFKNQLILEGQVASKIAL
ncbi:MAG: hypothetical protein JSS11_01105 [Verrucomicrobia bacterium]|nr:hypothetical protein [Verrucomicrobiota bacterium]